MLLQRLPLSGAEARRSADAGMGRGDPPSDGAGRGLRLGGPELWLPVGVAFRITGTRWSGPRFFGLKQRDRP